MSILEEIYASTLRFLTPLTVEDTYKIIVHEAVKLVDGESGRIFLADGKNFINVYNSSPEMPLFNPRKKGNVFRSFSKNKAFIVHSNEVKKTYPQLGKSNVRSIMYIPLSNNGKSYGVMIIRSKKDKKFNSEELSILKLFGSLANLAMRKSQLYAEIKESLDSRDLFISLAAHELRTPLTSVNGYIQLLKTRIKNREQIPPRWVMELEMESNRLKQLVEEFLEINSIRTGRIQFDFKEASLSKIIKRSISVFGFNKPDRKIVFENKLNSPKDTVIGDQNKLTQVIVNVFENADKYSHPDKKILVTLEHKDSSYMIKIADRGRGIAEEDLPKIFKGFYKGKDSLHEGMGLGLYLAKNIIESHQGNIEIKSEINKGTKVQIKLPRMEEE